MEISRRQPMRLELHWRMLGSEVRVQPLFWVSSAILGLRFYQGPELGGVGFFAFWMVAVFVSVLLHEVGHLLAGRMFGACGQIVLGGLGGTTFLPPGLARWQRVIILLAGPLTSLLLAGGLFALTWAPFPEALRGHAAAVATGLYVLVTVNLAWGVLNLLPLWPLDGGRITREATHAVLGERGDVATLLLSLLTTAVLTVWVLVQARLRLIDRYDPRYAVTLEHSCVLLLYCFVLWTRSVGDLWQQPRAARPT